MSRRIALLSAAVALLGAGTLPQAASAADYPGGGDAARAFHGEDFRQWDGRDPRAERDFADRRAPGPVVFDERDPAWRGDRPGFVGGRRPAIVAGPAYAPPFADDGYDVPERPLPAYRAVSAGPAYGENYGGPDVGCTVQQVQSTTPAGWHKTVTHRTCYRR